MGQSSPPATTVVFFFLVQVFDRDGSGSIDFQEFYVVLTKYNHPSAHPIQAPARARVCMRACVVSVTWWFQ